MGNSFTLSAAAQGNNAALLPAMADASRSWQFNGVLTENRTPLTKVKALLVVTNFDGVKPADSERIRQAVFGSGDDFNSLRHHLLLSSGGQLELTGQMVTGVGIGPAPAGCPVGDMLARAKQGAIAQGVNPDDFTHLFVEFSSHSACQFSGQAASPGNWIVSNASGHKYWMWAHEFGHNLGAPHPPSLMGCPVVSGVVQLGGDCKIGPADDPTNSVGGGGKRLFPVDYQLYAGWLTDRQVPWLSKSGVYKLAPLWSNKGAQGYRIARSDGTKLSIEFRQPSTGFEDWPVESPFVNGVVVRVVAENARSIESKPVDTTPGSNAKRDMTDSPLMPGRSLFDKLSGATITVQSVGPDGAIVQIDLPSSD
ncbi:MAG: hypothetical protein RLZZ618_931 [Pseudomonadota bacterium]